MVTRRATRAPALLAALCLVAGLTTAAPRADGRSTVSETAPEPATLPQTATERAPPGGAERHVRHEIADGLAASPPGRTGRLGVRRSRPHIAAAPFSIVGLELPEGATARVRTADRRGRWSAWTALERISARGDAPDPGSEEAARAAARGRAATEPLWVGAATALQVELRGGAPREVTAHLLEPGALEQSAGQHAALPAASAHPHRALPEPPSGRPATLPASRADRDHNPPPQRLLRRREWGADESWRSGEPRYAEELEGAVVHHTAGANAYTRAQAPAIVRGIYHYHTQVLGWDDIGYNLLVDRYGRVYEGRAGGLGAPVIGAHARGFNTGSAGIAVLGSYGEAPPSRAARAATAEALAWLFARHDLDPHGRWRATSGGSSRHPRGERVVLPTIAGHRHVSRTACPGDALLARLPELRDEVEARVAERREPRRSELPDWLPLRWHRT